MNYFSAQKKTPPTLIIHGGRDHLVPFNQSCQLYTYMKQLRKDVTFYKIQDGSHGGLGFDNDVVLDIIIKFLEKHMRG